MNLHELVLENLQEVAGAEKFLVAGLLALIDASSGVQLQAALAEHLKQTEIQVTRIADVHTSLRLKLKSRICKPMVGLLADAAKATPTKPAGISAIWQCWAPQSGSSTSRSRFTSPYLPC